MRCWLTVTTHQFIVMGSVVWKDTLSMRAISSHILRGECFVKSECAINLFQVSMFEKIIQDIPDSAMLTPALGHGHTPIWILGHLAIVAELGQQLLGTTAIEHQDWLELFGPGSPDPITHLNLVPPSSELIESIKTGYDELRNAFEAASANTLDQDHQISLFRNTPISTVGHAVSLLLTNHFGFHLSQLSSVRRSQGKPPLF